MPASMDIKRVKGIMNNLVETKYDYITYKIIGLAMEVRSRLGSGLKEENYQKAMEEIIGIIRERGSQ